MGFSTTDNQRVLTPKELKQLEKERVRYGKRLRKSKTNKGQGLLAGVFGFLLAEAVIDIFKEE